MRIHLSDEDKKRLIREERERRKIARQHQVRVQSDAYIRKQTNEIKKKKIVVEHRVRSGLKRAIANQVENIVDSIRNSSREDTLSSITNRSSISRGRSFSENQPSRKLRQRPITRTDAEVAVLRGKEAHLKLLHDKDSVQQRRESALRRKQVAREQANLIMKQGVLVVPNSR